MEPISTIEAEQKLRESGLNFVTTSTVAGLFDIENGNTIHKMLLRWEKAKILTRLRKGLYLLRSSVVNDFEVANIVLEPSYVSLETALNFYGILPQFPFLTTSVTPLKGRRVIVDEKEYEYSKISKDLYWGYELHDKFLIAVPEKAILDQLYFTAKKLRMAHVDEWDLSRINKSRLRQYAKKFEFLPLTNLLKKERLI